MKKIQQMKLISLLAVLSTSSAVLASGSHGGGHQGGMNMGMMKGGQSHWMSPSAEASRENPVPATEASIKTGASLFQQNCASCHGKNADGQGPAGMMLNPRPANLRVMAGGHPDGDFAYKIREGRGSMPAWKSALNEKQIWHLVNYIQTLNKSSHAEQAEQTGHGHADGAGHDS